MKPEDVEFSTGDVTLRGWFFAAQGSTGPAPVVVMAHGLSAVKELCLADYAEVFAAAGLNVLVYDHRNFGASDGILAKRWTRSGNIVAIGTPSPMQSLDPRWIPIVSGSGGRAFPAGWS